MSSHHIIRDEQEPPILIFQLNDNWQELSELLGWSPVVLIKPALKEQFDLRQTKIDGYLIKGDNHEISDQNFVYSDANLVDSLLGWIEKKNYTAINLFCDHISMMELFAQLRSKHLPIPLVFFTENGKYILKPGDVFKKWYPEKFKIAIVNDDLKKLINLKKGKTGYVVEKDGFAQFEVEGNVVMIKERDA